jgi:hypothetical protein
MLLRIVISLGGVCFMKMKILFIMLLSTILFHAEAYANTIDVPDPVHKIESLFGEYTLTYSDGEQVKYPQL